MVAPLPSGGSILISPTGKRAEEALRASERRYRALYDDNPSMYFTVSADGTVLSVNPFGARQLGYTCEALTGNSFVELVHEDDRTTVEQLLMEAIAQPERLHTAERCANFARAGPCCGQGRLPGPVRVRTVKRLC